MNGWHEPGREAPTGPRPPDAPSNRDDTPRGMVWMMLGALFFCLLGGLLIASGVTLRARGWLLALLLIGGGLVVLLPALGLARRALTLVLVALSQWGARRQE